MIDSLHLYPEEKARLQELEQYGCTVETCNNWLCPFNNDGYCVSPEHGDECGVYGDKDFKAYLDAIYDESLPDDVREAYRTIAIWIWGRKEESQ